MVSNDKTLRRSQNERMIAGVCGGLAEFFGLSATKVRLVYAACSVLSVAFPGILIYIVLWILVPQDEGY